MTVSEESDGVEYFRWDKLSSTEKKACLVVSTLLSPLILALPPFLIGYSIGVVAVGGPSGLVNEVKNLYALGSDKVMLYSAEMFPKCDVLQIEDLSDLEKIADASICAFAEADLKASEMLIAESEKLLESTSRLGYELEAYLLVCDFYLTGLEVEDLLYSNIGKV